MKFIEKNALFDWFNIIIFTVIFITLLAFNVKADECCCKEKVVYKTRWKTKVVYKTVEKVVEKPVYVYKTVVRTEYKDYDTDSLSLLFENSPTKVEVSKANGVVTVEQKRETGVGILYQHDFGPLRTSLGAVTNGSFIGGLGVSF